MEDIIHPGGKNIKELHRDDAFLVQQINSKHGGIALDSLLVNPEKKIAVRRNSKSPQTFEAKLEFYRDFLKAKKISVKSRGQVLYQYYTQEYIRPAAHSEEFSQFVTFIIIVASILVGVQTYDLSEGFTLFLNVVDAIILAIFTFEVVFKIAAEGCSPLKYFGDSWQVFDFVVVVFCYIPEVQAHATMLRLLRLLRVLKVLKAFPELNVIVKSITSSLPSLGYISLLIMLLFYLFGIIAVLWFGANDPHHFGSLHVAILSLWRSATGEDWTELMYTAMYGCDAVEAQGGYYGDGIAGSKCTDNQSSYAIGILYHVFFVTFGGMILLNLAVGVVIGSLFEAKAQGDGDYIVVEIDRAENLVIADYDVSGVSSSDPYVKATVGDVTYSTKVVHNNINPLWKETLPKITYNEKVSTILKLEVFDWDLFGADDLLGSFELDFSSLRWNKPVRFKLELNDTDGKESFLYLKIRKTPGANHLLLENEKDRWDKIQDKFFIAKRLIKDIEDLLRKRREQKLEEKKRKRSAMKKWATLNMARRFKP